MDVSDLRESIPALDRVVHLNTGATSPSPRPVVESVRKTISSHEYDALENEGMYGMAYELFDETRLAVADVLGTTPERIALTNSTTDGLNIIAGAIDWNENDTVVTTDLEHPSGILPWKRGKGDVTRISTEDGRIDRDTYIDAVSDATLVSLSSISWNYGTRLPIKELTEIAHEAGARVVVDAAQSPGHLPVNVEDWGADYVAGTGHKWLLGPWGAGFLYARSGVDEFISDHRAGSKSIDSFDYETGRAEFKTDASRLHSVTLPVATVAGLQSAAELYLEIGPERIRDRIEELTGYLKSELGSDRVLSPETFESGLVSFHVSDPEATVDRLSEQGVIVRSIPYPEAVRASVHAFNTRSDIDALVEQL